MTALKIKNEKDEWVEIPLLKGETGNGIKSTTITYQAGTSGTTAPSGTWSTNIPTITKGQYLWTRAIITFDDNTTKTMYSVGYQGTDGKIGSDGNNGNDGATFWISSGYSSVTDGVYKISKASINEVNGGKNVKIGDLVFIGAYYYVISSVDSSYAYASKRVSIKGDKGEDGENKYFVITEDMFTLTTDATKGVAPYNTSYGYTDITIKDDSGVEWIEGGLYLFVIKSKVATSTYRNVRVRIGEAGDWKPICGVSNTIAVGSTVFVKASTVLFIYKTVHYTTGSLNSLYDTNTTYSTMTQNELDTGTQTAGRLVPPSILKTELDKKQDSLGIGEENQSLTTIGDSVSWRNKSVGYLSDGDDAAEAILGENWRLPTKDEVTELLNNTNKQFDSTKAVWKFSNKKDSSKYIILPLPGYKTGESVSGLQTEGYYWSSTISEVDEEEKKVKVRVLHLSSTVTENTSDSSYYGQNIRPVTSTDKDDKNSIDLGLPSGIRWAKFNLCSTGFVAKEEYFGDYFSWGETSPKDSYKVSSWKYYNELNRFTGKTEIDRNSRVDAYYDENCNIKYLIDNKGNRIYPDAFSNLYGGSITITDLNNLDTSTLEPGTFYSVYNTITSGVFSGDFTFNSKTVAAGAFLKWNGSEWLSDYDEISSSFKSNYLYSRSWGAGSYIGQDLWTCLWEWDTNKTGTIVNKGKCGVTFELTSVGSDKKVGFSTRFAVDSRTITSSLNYSYIYCDYLVYQSDSSNFFGDNQPLDDLSTWARVTVNSSGHYRLYVRVWKDMNGLAGVSLIHPTWNINPDDFAKNIDESKVRQEWKDESGYYRITKIKYGAGAKVSVSLGGTTYNSTNGLITLPNYITGGSQTSTSTVDGGSNVYTFTKTDGSTSTLTVKNGSKGSNGTGVTISSTSVTYQAGTSGTTAPTGTWSTNIPTVTKGQYLWSKTVVTYSDGKSTTTYNVGYQGTNGTDGTNGSNATTTAVVSTSANGLAPKVTNTNYYLKGDGTWANPVSGYLPLSGGTMTGTITLKQNQYRESGGGINCNNADIVGCNSIYTGDLADNTSEGIRFYRDSTHWDSLTASGGVLYFKPNDLQAGVNFTDTSVKKVEFQGHTHSDYAVSKVLTNENLNNITTPGFYSAAGDNSCTNTQTSGNAFGLEVIHNATGSYYTQILHDYKGKDYRRYCDNGTWSSWAEIKYTDTNTDTKVTSAANHYSPTVDSGSAITATASGGTAAWSIDVVKGLTVSRDSKGHVTNVTVTSGKLPANPNTDAKVEQAVSTSTNWRSILTGNNELSTSSTTATTATNKAYMATGVSVQPSTGTIHAKSLILDPGTNSNYTEGVRVNAASDGWAILNLGGTANSTSGAATDGWIIGRRGDNHSGSGVFGPTGSLYFGYGGSNTATGVTMNTGGSVIASGMVHAKNGIRVGGTYTSTLVSGGCTQKYNATTQCLEFTFE